MMLLKLYAKGNQEDLARETAQNTSYELEMSKSSNYKFIWEVFQQMIENVKEN